jgi:mono/diheme cytochrome c family protein
LTKENPLKLTFLTIAILTATSAFAADAAAGKAIYATKCKTCHGADGDGNPAMAKALKVEIKPLSATTSDVKGVIVNGQGKMKPMPAVAGADLDNVVAYVKTMKK